MKSRYCFHCGGTYETGAQECASCHSSVPSDKEYSEQLAQLRNFYDSRSNGVSSLIIILILLLLMWWLGNFFLDFLLPASTDPFEVAARQWAIPLVVGVLFLALFVPKLVRWLRMRSQWKWTREQQTSLKKQLKIMPRQAFASSSTTGESAPGSATSSSQTQNSWRTGILAVIVVVVVVVVFVVMSSSGGANFGNLTSWFSEDSSSETATQYAVVEGEYRSTFAEQDLGDGVTRVEQTWAYVFFPDGTYTTYLEGSQQYSGTWQQTGSDLAVTVPAIPGGTEEYVFHATVSADANSFVAGESTWTRVEP